MTDTPNDKGDITFPNLKHERVHFWGLLRVTVNTTDPSLSLRRLEKLKDARGRGEGFVLAFSRLRAVPFFI